MADTLWASIKVDWHKEAVCNGADSSWFFPIIEADQLLEKICRQFCDHCPVRGKCLNSALINKDTGFWGGTSTDMRRAMIRNRNRMKCPICHGIRLIKIPLYQVCLACGASWKITYKEDTEEAILSCV